MNRIGEYNVLDYGAVGDGHTLDTVGVQHAIDSCSADGGGIILFPSGCSFLIGTIFLKSHMTIHIADNAAILGSRNLNDYSKETGFCPYYPEPLDPCLIYAVNEKGISFTGQGVIDGQFEEDFSSKHDDPLNHDSEQRPMLIRLENCAGVSMGDLTLRGSFSWCVHIKYCSNVKLRGLTILNDRQDGFNIESSSTINISDCTLLCGDDGIALTTSHPDKPLKDLTITNCVISSRWAAFRIGPLSKGDFENIVMSNCVLKDCGGGGIKIGMFEGAAVRNCIFSSLVMRNVTAPVLVMNAQWTDIGSRDPVPRMMPPGVIADIKFSNLIIEAHAGPTLPWDRQEYSGEEIVDFLLRPDRNSTIFLHGHKDGNIDRISLKDIRLVLPGGGTIKKNPFEELSDMHEVDIHEHGYWTDDKTIWGIPISSAVYARHVKTLQIEDMDVSHKRDEKRPAFAFTDCGNLCIRDITVDDIPAGKLDVIHRNCRNIRK